MTDLGVRSALEEIVGLLWVIAGLLAMFVGKFTELEGPYVTGVYIAGSLLIVYGIIGIRHAFNIAHQTKPKENPDVHDDEPPQTGG